MTLCMVIQAIGIFGIGPTHLFIRWRRSPPAPHLILIQPPSRGISLLIIPPRLVEHVDGGGVVGGVVVGGGVGAVVGAGVGGSVTLQLKIFLDLIFVKSCPPLHL